MTGPSVAVCVGFRARNDHDVRVWDWCRRRWEALFPDYQLCVADTDHELFNRSAAHNAAARLAGNADVLILINSDTTFQYADDIRECVRIAADGQWSLSANYVETSEGYWSVMRHENPAADMADPLSSYDRQLPNSPAGPQIVRRDWFEDIGGFDEQFLSWGWERRSPKRRA